MADITRTDQALADIEAVYFYIARDAPRYAELFARQVFQTTDRLVVFPRVRLILGLLRRTFPSITHKRCHGLEPAE
jgi:plasmid stabilization system protein ParE